VLGYVKESVIFKPSPSQFPCIFFSSSSPERSVMHREILCRIEIVLSPRMLNVRGDLVHRGVDVAVGDDSNFVTLIRDWLVVWHLEAPEVGRLTWRAERAQDRG